MKILHLTLKKKWFDLIASGEKKEEYREIKDYWARRFLDAVEPGGIEWGCWEEMLSDMRHPFNCHTNIQELLDYFGVRLRQYDSIKFKNGYGKKSPELLIECKGITVKNGEDKWGAEKGTFYFALQLGRILSA